MEIFVLLMQRATGVFKSMESLICQAELYGVLKDGEAIHFECVDRWVDAYRQVKNHYPAEILFLMGIWDTLEMENNHLYRVLEDEWEKLDTF
ncbi:hypothetical protein [Enterocloster hominis (ex Hitch et al. 2024)]|uniref:Uncharacterized protein n=1 Tax=Enterocloster hominis (ex Hitch et al. 2024) TaxID=1917870 RepID=A0ABV1DBU4_9FIRM